MDYFRISIDEDVQIALETFELLALSKKWTLEEKYINLQLAIPPQIRNEVTKEADHKVPTLKK